MRPSYMVGLCLALLPPVVFARQAPAPGQDPAMEARVSRAWAEVREHALLAVEGKAAEADDPQPLYAAEFFRYFRAHPGTPTGIKAGEAALAMWGNLGADDKIDEALLHVPPGSELWSRILGSVASAYGRRGRSEDFAALLLHLEAELTHPRSRSALLLRLANYYHDQEQPEKRQAALEEVVRLGAHPFDVQQAASALYEMTALAIGQAAPDFEVRTLDGAPITLSELRGKVVLLEFWSTTCGPCMPEIPHLKRLHEELPASKFVVIGLAGDDDLTALRGFLEEKEMRWPQVQQVMRWEGEAARPDPVLALYNVYGIPRSFLIGPDGSIAAKDLQGEEAEKAVRALVAGVRD